MKPTLLFLGLTPILAIAATGDGGLRPIRNGPLTKADAERIVANTSITPLHRAIAQRSGDHDVVFTLNDPTGNTAPTTVRAIAVARSILGGRFLEVALEPALNADPAAPAITATLILGVHTPTGTPQLLWIDSTGETLRPLEGTVDADQRVLAFAIAGARLGEVSSVVVTLVDDNALRVEFRARATAAPGEADTNLIRADLRPSKGP
jgi:hypothetical protein